MKMFLIWRNTCGSILGAKTSLYAEDLQITTEEQLCIFVWIGIKVMELWISEGKEREDLVGNGGNFSHV
ncbi:hypothetical protein H5410_025717 [Solanum commersonii]|uniref:Uncharacterized protein n=1 Tax=Solanum commersonii TaxID=4109 RepID=A0A9J5YUJ3_SOLCO|nr:hypothetical protein H5410_025717 [Solanum commersonii]